MKRIFTSMLWLASLGLGFAQTVADFENFDLSSESFLNGSDGSGGFSSGNVFLSNVYNTDYDFWSGWAISNTTDTQTPGFLNQYSAITGGGANGSDTYALTFISGESVINLEGDAQAVEGMYVTNNTYAYLSMQEGDTYAKKFGGDLGDDPDFFLLTIKKYENGVLGDESVEFYMADYRFEDNSMDYIVDEWTYLDLTSLGSADSLQLTLTSSDVSPFGINTPAYVCVDQIETKETTSVKAVELTAVNIYPNPTTDFISIDNDTNSNINYTIFDVYGQLVQQASTALSHTRIGVNNWTKGTYIIQVTDGEKVKTERIIVQ